MEKEWKQLKYNEIKQYSFVYDFHEKAFITFSYDFIEFIYIMLLYNMLVIKLNIYIILILIWLLKY